MKKNWKKGDRFIPLPEDEWGDNDYRIGWGNEMKKLIGKELTVKHVSPRYLSCGDWHWGFAQIRPAKRTMSLTIKPIPL